MNAAMFIVVTPDDPDECFPTLEKAEEHANLVMADMRSDAASDGEWPDSTDVKIYQMVKHYEIGPTGMDDEHDFVEAKIE